jgi:hypothetical protein
MEKLFILILLKAVTNAPLSVPVVIVLIIEKNIIFLKYHSTSVVKIASASSL